MNSKISKYELHSVRLDSDVWAWLKEQPRSLNQILRSLCDVASVPRSTPKPESDVIRAPVVRNTAPRKLSKKAQLAEARKAADPVAQNLGRDDIDYMNPDELPSAGSVGVVAPHERAQAVPARPVADWRAGRKPLLKPKERK